MSRSYGVSRMRSWGQVLLPAALPQVFSGLRAALSIALILMVISMALLTAERRKPFPPWLPYALSCPVAWLLILPSGLEHGGPWMAWVLVGSLAAGLFCIHWRTFMWARTVWD